MELTAKRIEDITDNRYYYEGYTVYVEDHRILTIATSCYSTATKWLKDVQKSHRNKYGTILAGVCVDRQYDDSEDSTYDILQLCIGSHCLIYHLPDPYDGYYRSDKKVLKSFQAFFADPRVTSVGMDMDSVAKKLENDHEIKFANPVDLNSMAVEVLRRDDLNLKHYSLNRLAKFVLGKRVYVVRPKHGVEWYDSKFYWNDVFTEEKAKYATADPYLCYLIGSELLNMKNSPSSSSKKIKNKKKK